MASSVHQPASATVRPIDVDPPQQADDLTAWIGAILRTTHPVRLAAALHRAEATATQRFAAGTVRRAMQEAIAAELHDDADDTIVAIATGPHDVPGPRLSPSPAADPSRR
ncbi:hypothetical protein [Micromonospora echinofusca]|uniref:Uncharacterized protein n=1 Tax=Micromonospora echinofusca TaxID=47858 RepID=A0ABS3W0G6_MICEH|nr:hypothetical protein [Micromonospora echinofusca]MBO4210264.1 hypothetical protein [Micromonospora echinofusca]